MIQKETIRELAKTLKALKADGKSAVLFLGAGASKSAGVPLAGELAEILLKHENYGPFVSDLADKSYVSCISKLKPVFRKKFLKEYTETAKINQAHLYAASLMKAGYIDTVATVNFDQLMVKALSLVNIYPNVYDLAASNGFILGGIESPSVVYLHGQSNGFWQFNTEAEMDYGRKNIESFFTSHLANRAIIVLGYSGVDPVFEILSQVKKFEQGFYWVGYQDHAPIEKVQEFLKASNKSCYLIEGFNADTFMDNLKRELQVEEPHILSKPFTHVKEALEIIGDFELLGDVKIPWTKNVKEWVTAAIEGFEEGRGFRDLPQAKDDSIHVGRLIEKAKEILSNGNYEKVSEIESDIKQSGNVDALMYLAFIYDNWGASLYLTKGDGDSISNIESAIEKLRRAIELKPDLIEAYSNLGAALGDLALLLKSESTFDESVKMFEVANALAPDNWNIYYNMGHVLFWASTIKENKEETVDRAIACLNSAIALNPDFFPVYGLLGELWFSRSKRHGFELNALEKSVQNFNVAMRLGGKNHYGALTTAALAKANLGIKKNDISLVKEAIDLYENAYKSNPKDLMVIGNYGIALLYLSRSSRDIEECNKAIALLEEAHRIDPDDKGIMDFLSNAKETKAALQR